MKRLVVVLAVGIGLQIFALGALAEDANHDLHDHQAVRITNSEVRPEVLTLHAEDAIGWLNYSRQRAVISFDEEVAKKLTCKAKSVFRLTGGRLESAPIQAQQFASLCSLAPGEYDYYGLLSSGAGSDSGAGRKLEGKLVVQ